MPPFKAAVRAAATLAAIAGGTTIAVATTAQADAHAKSKHAHGEHGKAEHDKRRHVHDEHDPRNKHARGRHDRGRHDRGRHDRGKHGHGEHDKTFDHRRRRPTTTTPTTTTPTTTTPTTTTPTTTTPTTTTPTTTPASTPMPTGVGGSWKLAFDDEFNGTSLNTSVWNNHDGWTNQNNVTDHASNITVSGGYLTLTLASSTSGATIGTNQNVLAVGDFAEARVEFSGSGTTIYNWPAWWASGPNWPAAGENDIAEGLGTLTVNYHSPSGADNTGTVPGVWANAFHTFGIYRGSNYCNVYYDGQLVRHYATNDNGAAQELLFTMGAGNTLQFGSAGQMKVDYVRVWAPA